MVLKGKACFALLATLESPFLGRLWMTRCKRPNADVRKEIIALTNELRLPTMFPYREFVDEGGLGAYAVEVHELWRRAAHCADELLRGASDVPYYQASTFRLIINVEAARRLGLTLPSSLSWRADEVVE